MLHVVVLFISSHLSTSLFAECMPWPRTTSRSWGCCPLHPGPRRGGPSLASAARPTTTKVARGSGKSRVLMIASAVAQFRVIVSCAEKSSPIQLSRRADATSGARIAAPVSRMFTTHWSAPSRPRRRVCAAGAPPVVPELLRQDQLRSTA